MVCRRSVQWQKSTWSICLVATCTGCHGLQAFRTVAEEHVIYLPSSYMYWLPWFAGVPYSGRRACDLFAYWLHVLIAMVCRHSVQWQKSMWSICLLATCTDCHGLQAFRTVAEEHVIYLPIVYMYWLPWFAGIPYSGRRACDLFAYCLHVLVAMVCRRSVQWQKSMWSVCLLSTCTDCHGLLAFRTVAEEHVIYLPMVCMYWLPWLNLFAGVPYSVKKACDLFAYCLHVLVAMVCRRSVQWQKSMWSICLLSTCTDCHGLQAFRTVAEEHVIYLPIVYMYGLPWFAGVPYSGRGTREGSRAAGRGLWPWATEVTGQHYF